MSPYKVDICYVISHGFAARMLLQTGLIQRLSEEGKTIAIITPDPNDDNLTPLKENPHVAIYSPGLSQTIWDDNYNFKRKYYLENIRQNPVFWEKHLYSIFYTTTKHPWKRIRPFWYYFIYRLISYFPNIRTRFKETENRHLFSKKAAQLLAKIAPQLVVSTYPVNFLEAKFMYAAKQQGRATLIHLLSWDNITSKGIFPVIPDHFIAWGSVMYQELKAYYQVREDQVHICGVPHFDQHHRVKQQALDHLVLQELGLDPSRPYLFFAMSSPRFAPGEIEIVEWLSQAIKEKQFGPGLQLIVRPHPQNVQGSMADKSWLKRLDRLQHAKVAIDYPQLINSKVRWSMRKSDMERLSQLLKGCSICLNSGSTVSIDALMMGKPVILTSFDGAKPFYYWKSARRLIDYPHQKKFVEMGGAKPVYSFKHLQTAIQAYLNQPLSDQERRDATLQAYCYKNDGLATQRVVTAMLKVLHQLQLTHV